ncbi:unnamed protein product [Prorocentrum cordatum]|uniref:Uncharacterized protein n=1 Tax=Prorocentrum cordatum TaxID=2364126 RepID=A0ABN9VCS7_9DINO|nr:unnamed protein product [Polarella glacialis]
MGRDSSMLQRRTEAGTAKASRRERVDEKEEEEEEEEEERRGGGKNRTLGTSCTPLVWERAWNLTRHPAARSSIVAGASRHPVCAFDLSNRGGCMVDVCSDKGIGGVGRGRGHQRHLV